MNVDNLNRPLDAAHHKGDNKFDINAFKQRVSRKTAGTGGGGGDDGLILTVKAKSILGRPPRAFRVVELHDMWIAMNSAPRAWHWADLANRRPELIAEIRRREVMIEGINSEIFERALAVRSAPPGSLSEPVIFNALEASRKMGQRGVDLMVKESKTGQDALDGHRPPGDTTKVCFFLLCPALHPNETFIHRADPCDCDCAQVNAVYRGSAPVYRKREKELAEQYRNSSMIVLNKEKPQWVQKRDAERAAKASAERLALMLTSTDTNKPKKKKKKGQKDDDDDEKKVERRLMTKDVKRRAVEFFLRYDLCAYVRGELLSLIITEGGLFGTSLCVTNDARLLTTCPHTTSSCGFAASTR